MKAYQLSLQHLSCLPLFFLPPASPSYLHLFSFPPHLSTPYPLYPLPTPSNHSLPPLSPIHLLTHLHQYTPLRSVCPLSTPALLSPPHLALPTHPYILSLPPHILSPHLLPLPSPPPSLAPSHISPSLLSFSHTHVIHLNILRRKREILKKIDIFSVQEQYINQLKFPC